MCPPGGDTQAEPYASLLADALQRIWGYSEFRPLQREAMHAILDRRDSLVVLPTGGGKSLCFQAPAVVSWEPALAGLSQGSAEAGPYAGGRRRGLALVV